MKTPKVKAGYVGVVGLPNVGKSTLVNHICGAKVGITSNKPQTTRRNILGIKTTEEAQMIFVDSPGFIQSEKGLNSFLESEWKRVLEDVDGLVFVISLDSKKESVEKTFMLMDTARKPFVVVITKTDLNQSDYQMSLEEELKRREVTYYTSRRKGRSESLTITDKFLEKVLSFMPEADGFYYDKDLYTTQTMRELTSECVLENIFRVLEDELPYESGVMVRDFKEEPNIYKIYADVIVSKDRYKGIIVGKGGQTIKKIGMQTRIALEQEFQKKVFLELNVKVKPDWNKKSGGLKELGYYDKRSN